MKKIFIILALVLALAPATVLANGISLMVGPQSVSFGADLGKYYDIPAGAGFTLLVGLDMGIPLDIRVGRRTTTEGKSGEDVTYQWVEFGPRFFLGDKELTVRGDFFAGVGSYDFKLGSLDYDSAIGGYVGMGIEETVSEKYLGRVEVKAVSWKSDTLSTDGVSLNIGLLFGYKF